MYSICYDCQSKSVSLTVEKSGTSLDLDFAELGNSFIASQL